MADFHDRYLYAETVKDILTNYLINDIIRILLLTNPSLDVSKMNTNLILFFPNNSLKLIEKYQLILKNDLE